MALEGFFTAAELKDGLGTIARVEDLVSAIKSDFESQQHPFNDKSQQVAVGSVLAATEERECLEHFVRLNGLSFLSEWLQESQRLTENVEDSSVDDLVNVLLGALDRLPVDLEKSTASGIGSTVSRLAGHRNPEIQEKARGITMKWSQEGLESTPKVSQSAPGVNAVTTPDGKDSEQDAKFSEGMDPMIPSEEVDEEKDVSPDVYDNPADNTKTFAETEKSTPKSQTFAESHGCGFDLNEDISGDNSTPASPGERNLEKSTLKSNHMEIDLNVVHDDDAEDDVGTKRFSVDLNRVETEDGPRHHSLSNQQGPSFNIFTAVSSSSVPPQHRDFDLNDDPSLSSGQSGLCLTFRERSPSRSLPQEDSPSPILITYVQDEKITSSGASEPPNDSTLTSLRKSTISVESDNGQQTPGSGSALKRKEPDCGLDSCKVSTSR